MCVNNNKGLNRYYESWTLEKHIEDIGYNDSFYFTWYENTFEFYHKYDVVNWVASSLEVNYEVD